MRLSWDQYFLQIATQAATRSTCFSPQKGAVIVRDNNIISTGYSGAPKGMSNCKFDLGYCRRKRKGFKSGEGLNICRASHAEANAIVQAARHGQQTEGATIYCTHLPCNDCAKLIINAGIVEVVYIEDYSGSEAIEWFNEVGVKVRKL